MIEESKLKSYHAARLDYISFKNQNMDNSGYYLENHLLHLKKQILKNDEIYKDPNKIFGRSRLLLVLFAAILGFYYPYYFDVNIIICFLTSIFIGLCLFEILHKIPLKNYLKNLNYSKLTLDFIKTERELNLKNNLIFIQYLLNLEDGETLCFIGKPQTQVPSKDDLIQFQDFSSSDNFPSETYTRLTANGVFDGIYIVENVLWHSGASPQSVTIEIKLCFKE